MTTATATEPTTIQREARSLFPTYDRLKIGVVSHASGMHIHTDQGSYVDMIAGLGVNALGHSHPLIVDAIREQAGKYLHLSNLYYQEPQVRLAEQLQRMSGWERIFFTNSGTEAVEGALKLARKYVSSATKTELVGLPNSFHGRTYGALSVMDKEKYRMGYGPFLEGSSAVGELTEEAIERHLTVNTAAVILEVIQGEGGIVTIPENILSLLTQLREKYGFLIIADEIQSGIGRTGKFLAYEHTSLKPDIVVCAKAIGGGLPLGAILTSEAIAEALRAGVHGTTFGGNALACVAGSVVLDQLEDGLMHEVAAKGEWFKGELEKICYRHPGKIYKILGRGFMLGVSYLNNAKPVHAALLERGYITNVTHETILRLLPPLIADKNELGLFLEALEAVTATLTWE